MKKNIYIFIGLLLLGMIPNNVEALGASLNRSANNITPGNTVKITSTISSNNPIFFIEGTLKCSGAGVDSSINLNFDNMDNSIKSNSKNITVKPTSTGTITCNTNAKVIDSSNSNWQNVTKSITINVVKPREKSTNNNLKSLSVEGYSISPEFNKDTLEYSVELPADQTKIKINASKEDGYSSLNGTGEKDVVEGENRFEIIVTSETGKSKTYVLLANVKDNNPIIVKVNDKELTVVKRSTSLTKPSEDFTDTKVTINEIEIPAFYNEKTNITLVGLKDSEGITNLYIYNEEKQTYAKYQSLKSNSIQVIFTEAKKIPEDYKKTTIKIDDQEYVVYQNPKVKGYYLVYGMNLETGKSNWYRYHEEEKTLQLYDNQDITKIIKENEKDIENYKMIIIGLGAFSIILLVTILILVFTRKK